MLKYKRIVCIGAHPLDAEIMGGPFMMKYADKGAKCTFVHVTKGRLTDAAATDTQKAEYEAKLDLEIRNAAMKMSAEAYCMNYAAGELPSVAGFTEIIVDYLKKEKVDCVITHGRGTLHPRHYYTYEAATEAIRRLRREGKDIQLYYGENCEDLIGFTPTVYVTMSEARVEKWFDALRSYAIFNGKVNDVPYYEYYHSAGKIRAIEAGIHGFVKAYMHGALLDNE